MPSEHRQITFSTNEIIKAVTSLIEHRGTLPYGTVSAVRITEDDKGRITGLVSLSTRRTKETRELKLNAEILGAALIRLCRAEGIPLPRPAKKRLVRAGDGLALYLDLKSVEPALPSNDPAVDGDAAAPDWWAGLAHAQRQR
ncbi:MAG: hypothetical protein AB7P52_09900 [Alphaproteobacteria bacterium]